MLQADQTSRCVDQIACTEAMLGVYEPNAVELLRASMAERRNISCADSQPSGFCSTIAHALPSTCSTGTARIETRSTFPMTFEGAHR
jgi:hypothetical protein